MSPVSLMKSAERNITYKVEEKVTDDTQLNGPKAKWNRIL